MTRTESVTQEVNHRTGEIFFLRVIEDPNENGNADPAEAVCLQNQNRHSGNTNGCLYFNGGAGSFSKCEKGSLLIQQTKLKNGTINYARCQMPRPD